MFARVVGPAKAKAAKPANKGRPLEASSESTKTRRTNAAPQKKPTLSTMAEKSASASSTRVRNPNSSETTRPKDGPPTVDLLAYASQLYPWMFMSHSLAEASKASQAKFEAQFMARVREIEAEEEASREDCIRYQAERQIELLDEISSEHLCRHLPDLIRQMIQSGEYCQNIIAGALETSQSEKPDIQTIRNELQRIDTALQDLRMVQTTMNDIVDMGNVMGPHLTPTFKGFRMLLESRTENLVLCKKILTGIRENERTIQHLRSLELENNT